MLYEIIEYLEENTMKELSINFKVGSVFLHESCTLNLRNRLNAPEPKYVVMAYHMTCLVAKAKEHSARQVMIESVDRNADLLIAFGRWCRNFRSNLKAPVTKDSLKQFLEYIDEHGKVIEPNLKPGRTEPPPSVRYFNEGSE
jgi:hypothetical protein